MGILHAEVVIEDPLIHSRVPVKKDQKRIRAAGYVGARAASSCAQHEVDIRLVLLPPSPSSQHIWSHLLRGIGEADANTYPSCSSCSPVSKVKRKVKHSTKLLRKPGGVSALFPSSVVLITEFGAMLKLVEILLADGAASGKTAPGSSSRPDDDSLTVPLSLALVFQPSRAISTPGARHRNLQKARHVP